MDADGSRSGAPAVVGQLTHRERQVLEGVVKGLTNGQIGHQLGLARSTVRNYVSGAYQKIGVSGRVQAAVWWQRHWPEGSCSAGLEDIA